MKFKVDTKQMMQILGREAGIYVPPYHTLPYEIELEGEIIDDEGAQPPESTWEEKIKQTGWYPHLKEMGERSLAEFMGTITRTIQNEVEKAVLKGERRRIIETIKQEEKEKMMINIGMLRQWLNEDRITDPKRMVKNEDIQHWLGITLKDK